jgi:hypothetical protein
MATAHPIQPPDHSAHPTGAPRLRFTELSDETADLLRLAAQLADAPIARELLVACFAELDPSNLAAAERRADIAMQQALALALAEPVAQTTELHLSPLARQAAHESDPDLLRQLVIRRAATVALDSLMQRAEDAHQQADLTHLRQHAAVLAKNANDLHSLRLAGRIGRHDLAAGRYAAARPWLELWHSGLAGRLGDDDEEARAALHSLAHLYQAQGDLDNTQRIQSRLLQLYRQQLGETHAKTVSAAWKLFQTECLRIDTTATRDLLQRHLLPLLHVDLDSLSAEVQHIRKQLKNHLPVIHASLASASSQTQPR